MTASFPLQGRSVLAAMQQLLVRLYDAPVEQDVRDFLVTSRQDHGGTGDVAALTDEQLVLVEPDEPAGDPLRLGLYIDAAVLGRLNTVSPFARLDASNLADYCTALEGVSHFHYVVWSCAHRRSVSLLELELQAEVDKYAGAMLLLTTQTGGQFPAALHRQLFDRVRYAAGLDAASLQRYQIANRQAAKFCRYLDERFLRTRRVQAENWLAALRRFYRLGSNEKLRQVCHA